jgi:O-antigen/teichoic acid export membrane protein
VSEILFPTLVQRHRAGDTAGFCQVLSKTIRVSGIVILLPAAIGAGAAAGILNIFGPGFSEVSGAFAILLFAYGLGVAAMGIGQALMAAGRPHLLSVIGVTRAVVGVVLLIPGAIIGGTIGAALALLIAVVAEAALGSFYLVRLVGRSSLPSFRHILGVTVASALAFAASRVVDVNTTTFGGTLVAMAAGSVVYIVAVVPVATESDERAMAWAKVRSLRKGGGGDGPDPERAADEAPVAGR